MQSTELLLKTSSQELIYPQVRIAEDSAKPVKELQGTAGLLRLSCKGAALQHRALQFSHCAQCHFWLMLLNLVFGEV